MKTQMQVVVNIAVELDTAPNHVTSAIADLLNEDGWIGEDWALLTIVTTKIGEVEDVT